MKIYLLKDLEEAELARLLVRNSLDAKDLVGDVEEIIKKVQTDGDTALLHYSKKFDGVDLSQIRLGKADIDLVAGQLSVSQRTALKTAYDNLWTFHQALLPKRIEVETMPGVRCWQEPRPIPSVALYVPGGTAPLPSTLLHLGVAARVAGCEKVIVLTPPRREVGLHPAIAGALQLLQIDEVYQMGGAQAIAAAAYGTATVPKVDKVFGPGNRYVTTAKTVLAGRGQVAIDLPAGPSEVLVIADSSADPTHVAVDLLAQAEHGADSQVVLCVTDEASCTAILQAVEELLQKLPRAQFARKALEQSYAVIDPSIEQLLEFSNRYAPEHLILNVADSSKYLDLINNAGSVFVGAHTPESVGDYASGTNHTLPTSGLAMAYSGVSTESFMKKVTFQQLTAEGLQLLGPTVVELAELETLDAHAWAVSLRLADLETPNH
jgi:histidinol dehydrogenase